MRIIVGCGGGQVKYVVMRRIKVNRCPICAYSKSQSLHDPRQDTFHCSPCNKSWFKGKKGEGIEFFICKHCGKPFKQLKIWKEGKVLTFARRYTPILANHLKHEHGEIFSQYKQGKEEFPQGRELERLEKENTQLVKGTEKEYSTLRFEFNNYRSFLKFCRPKKTKLWDWLVSDIIYLANWSGKDMEATRSNRWTSPNTKVRQFR